jgi:hypothetical protein
MQIFLGMHIKAVYTKTAAPSACIAGRAKMMTKLFSAAKSAQQHVTHHSIRRCVGQNPFASDNSLFAQLKHIRPSETFNCHTLHGGTWMTSYTTSEDYHKHFPFVGF